MELAATFFIAFIFSFVGSIPPGTLNLTMIHLGLDHKLNVAWRFGLAASLIEYPYAWLAIEFENIITANLMTERFQIITGIVMLLLGLFMLKPAATNPSRFSQRFHASGFRRGLVLGILNPLALPFWIFMTAYLKSIGWVDLSDNFEKHLYLMGIVAGAFSLLIVVAFLARQVVQYLGESPFMKKFPGVVLVFLGLYAIGKYYFN